MAGRLPPPTLHDTGSGPALLLLHAAPLDASQWDHQVAALSDSFRCLRPDFWGCGRSPQPPVGATLDGYAAAVLDRLDEIGVRTFATVGLSLGGYVSMAVLRQAGERVSAMVLADTRAGADTERAAADRAATAARARADGVEFMVERTIGGLLSAAGRDVPHITDPIRGRVRGYSPEGLAAQQEAMRARPDSSELLAGAGRPILLIVGDQDEMTSPDSMGELASTIPGARLAVIEGAGHLSNLEQPAAFSALLSTFLAESDQRTAGPQTATTTTGS